MTRNTCALAVVSVAVAGQAVLAQTNEVNVQFHGFQDTRDVQVRTPSVDIVQDVTDRISVRGSYSVDAISAASNSLISSRA